MSTIPSSLTERLINDDIPRWYETYGLPKDHAYAALDRLPALARIAASDYAERGVTFVPVEPGNATRYSMLLTDLSRVDLNDDLTRAEALPEITTAAGIVGGDLLVSMPLNRGGRAFTVGLPAYLTPDYVAEKMAERASGPAYVYGDAVPVAAFLSLFSAALDAYVG